MIDLLAEAGERRGQVPHIIPPHIPIRPGCQALVFDRKIIPQMVNKIEVEQLKEQEDIKTALKQTTGTKEAMPKPIGNNGDLDDNYPCG